MKIVHINNYLAPRGGAEVYLLKLLPLLKAQGIQSHVIYAEGDAEYWADSTHIPTINASGFTTEKIAKQHIEQILKQEKPDLIHLHNIHNIGIYQACLTYGPTLFTHHDHRAICPANSFFFKRTQEVCTRDKAGLGCFTTTLSKRCLTPRPNYAFYFFHRAKWISDHATAFAHVIAPCADAKKRLTNAGFLKNDITILPYFSSLKPQKQPRPAPQKLTITYMGRIAPNKGQEFFVEALGLLPNTYQGVMVGNFSDAGEKDLSALAKQYGCYDRLQLRKWATRQEVLKILDNTSVFVFPSLWPETLGIVGLEAFSRGVPVVASDIGGVREWLEDGINGFLAKPKSAQDIRDGVLKLTPSNEALLKFGQAGIDTIQRKFLPHHHIDKLIQVYNQAIQKT